MPSPQSKRIRSPPARSSSAGSPRRAVGTEPAVPAKNSETSMFGTEVSGTPRRARAARVSSQAPAAAPTVASTSSSSR